MERIDFQSWMPGAFDGRPFGPGDLEALEEEAGVGRCVVMPEAGTGPTTTAWPPASGAGPAWSAAPR